MKRPPEPDHPERNASAPPRSARSRSAEALLDILGLSETAPLDLRLLGRTLLHAGAVGVLAGAAGAAFFASLELAQRYLLDGVAGFSVLRARGEAFVAPREASGLRPLVLAALPALGALASGLVTAWLAPEAAGGGGDATIEAYHHGGVVRRRVIPVKALASIFTLSSGGSGGREGPTMQIGGAIGAAVGRVFATTRSERRVLLVAGVAAGIAAVFRTPLGAALLATEMLYRDDFEAEALVPSIFASVVSYSIVIAVFGETTLFGDLPRFPFRPAHLPLYAVLALAISVVAIAFSSSLRHVQRTFSGVPPWLRPALGGLVMGMLGTALVLWMRAHEGAEASAFGVFGGGYGILQVAISGAAWLVSGWTGVALLAAVGLAKLVASALTIGSGAAAGDFAPSLVIGGLVGAAFGLAARLLLGDASIQPAAFALVGMGTFYGGLAHAPLSALVLVAELAGSYDLLVPMMLAIGIAYVALRKHTLYPAQRASRMESPLHRPEVSDATPFEASLRRLARDLLVVPEIAAFAEHDPLELVIRAAADARGQRVVLVRGRGGDHAGLIELGAVVDLVREDSRWLRAHDAAVPFVCVSDDAGLGDVAEVLERCGLTQVPVIKDGSIVGWIGDREIRTAVLEAARSHDASE